MLDVIEKLKVVKAVTVACIMDTVVMFLYLPCLSFLLLLLLLLDAMSREKFRSPITLTSLVHGFLEGGLYINHKIIQIRNKCICSYHS